MRPGGNQRIPRPQEWEEGSPAPWRHHDVSSLLSFDNVVSRLSEHSARSIDTDAAQLARPSAVLVALYPGSDGAEVVLTKRASHLKNHRGEISFPGGRVEPEHRRAAFSHPGEYGLCRRTVSRPVSR